MRWLKPNLKSSIYALLGHGPAPSGNAYAAALDDIRYAMLGLLGEQGQAAHPTLTRRLRYATEVQSLWYARHELMGALAAVHGELKARKQLEGVTGLFEGLLPQSMNPRPSRFHAD